MYKNLARGLAAVLLAALAAPASTQVPGTAPLKVGFVYVSPVGDAGWTYRHDQGRQAMLRELGGKVQATIVESVPESADAERVMRDLARQGHGLIVATSFGYLEAALRVAADFPQVKFEHAGGYKGATNLATYNARYYEARYLAGMLAGWASRNGVAGYVAGFPVPEVVQGINAFTLGMRAANPKAQVRVLWLNTWFDPAREREAARSLIDQGADVLTHHSGSPAVAQAAQARFADKGVRFIAYPSDMHAYAPQAQLAAVTHHWGGFYTRVARSVLEGRWSNQPVWGGIQDGLVDIEAFAPGLDPRWLTRLAEQRAAIVAGRFQPFAAPLVDQDGKTRLAAGALDDGAIGAMNWFVQGVVGSLPASR